MTKQQKKSDSVQFWPRFDLQKLGNRRFCFISRPKESHGPVKTSKWLTCSPFSQKSVQKTRKLVNFSKNRPKICSNLNRKIKEDHKACFLGGFSLKALHFLAQIYLCFMLKSVCLAFAFLLHKWCPEKWGRYPIMWLTPSTYLLFSTFWKMSREKSSSSFENKYVCIFQNSLFYKSISLFIYFKISNILTYVWNRFFAINK